MDGRERREAEKELEMQEEKTNKNRRRKFDESTDSFGVQWQLKNAIVVVARMSEVPGVAMKGFC